MVKFEEDFLEILADVKQRYIEKGKKYSDRWKKLDDKEIAWILWKDFQQLVDEYSNSKVYKRVLDVALMSLISAARIKQELKEKNGQKSQ